MNSRRVHLIATKTASTITYQGVNKMREIEPGAFLVETVADLEIVRIKLSGRDIGFLDLETTSKNKDLTSLNPWHHCWVAGFAITAIGDRDNTPAFYIPVCHEVTLFDSAVNLPIGAVLECLKAITASWKLWVNANIKYDMHVMQKELGWIPSCAVEDIITVAKVHYSDSFLYNLTVLAEEYAGYSIKHWEDALQPYKVDNKDYGRIPVEVMCPYACYDVIAVRDIWNTLNRLLDPELDYVRNMEREVLSVLFDMEECGLTVKPNEVRVSRICAGHELLMRTDRLAESIDFPGFNTGSGKHMNEYFVNRLGLPVVKWTNEDDDDPETVHNPSFGKEAMGEYLVHPRAPTAIVKEVMEIRKLSKFYSAFLTPYDKLHINGDVHSDYNSLVRTGRMSCKTPNAQQLNTAAKRLIVPKPGCSLLSVDQSQIEFRTIVHYIKDERCIAAYLENPDTDFHNWVAEMAHIVRKNAKTVNFLMGYGGGKDKLIAALVKDPELVAGIKEQADEMLANGASMEKVEAYFNLKSGQLAEGIYTKYHQTLPSLKRTSYAVADAARANGFVRTLYKRRRHLRPNRAHIAFNSACQGTAADFIKDSLMRLRPVCKGAGVDIIGVIHDEILFSGPHNVIESEELLRSILGIMEKPQPLMPFRIPVRCKYGISRTSWADTGSKENGEKSYPLEKSDWLRT